ncbi:hypothetical protein [Chitinimonas koreensis]|uniref:hypothetical protein n=1 Tax=Chitinimonas koreensis TaxID=356302 RepID=UPI0004116DEE|nr:hypothetical protein [Chitinimonas koreensis]QNM96772.1 hypothetical protein H9L41_24050 [Chitinimonas koreensis]
MTKDIVVAGKGRHEWLSALQKELRKDAAGAAARIRDLRRTIADSARGGWDAGTLLNAGHALGLDACLQAAHARESGDADAAARLRAGFAALYWTLELDQHDRLAQRWSDDVRDDLILGRIFLHGLAAGGGAGEIAAWVAPMTLRLLQAEGGLMLAYADPALAAFMRALLEMQLRGRWALPDAAALRAMHSKGALLATADDPPAFAEALVVYCDDRLAQANGYADRNATRKNRADDTASLLAQDAPAFTLLPFELHSLRHVYQTTTGRPLSLAADHPLLAPERLALPALAPLHADDDTALLQAAGRKQFGAHWSPLTPAASAG